MLKAVLRKTANIIRKVSIPPVMAAILIVLVSINGEIYKTALDIVVAVLFLVITPVAAYPVSYIVPKFREGGRKTQRKLAFWFAGFGYLAAVIYSIAMHRPSGMIFIFLTYFISILTLSAVNKFTKTKASGHACSVIWPVITGIWYYRLPALIVGGLIYAAILWSSIKLKRHTAGEFIYGTLVCIFSAGLSALTVFVFHFPI